jgi:hypothetical protein
MFIGTSKLELNEATMIVAVQEYLDKRAKDGFSPLVKSVKAGAGNYNNCGFSVELSEPVADATERRAAA